MLPICGNSSVKLCEKDPQKITKINPYINKYN